VAFVIARLAFAGGAEWLAGARTCPNRSVIGPSGETQGVAPSTDAGEEMALGVASEVVGPHIDNGSRVDVAGCDVSGVDEVAEPTCGIGINLVVVGGHPTTFPQ
jgi:hypothetical protein